MLMVKNKRPDRLVQPFFNGAALQALADFFEVEFSSRSGHSRGRVMLRPQ